MTVPRARAAFVGRDAELAALGEALTLAVQGEAAVVICGGEAGIGKSRLAHEAASLARTAGMTVIEGGCVDLGGAGLPYGPVAEALRSAIETGSLDVAALPAAVHRQLALLVPTIGPASSADVSDDGAHGRTMLFEAILSAVVSMAQDHGLLFVVEDVHWAGPATRDALTYLIRNVRGHRVCLLMTLRTDTGGAADPWTAAVAAWARHSWVRRVDLPTLTDQGTAAQLASILGREPGASVTRAVQARSDGNPYFIEQLAWAHLDGEDASVPSGLRELLLSRLARLSPDAQSIVSVVAVAEEAVDERFLSTVLQWRPERLHAPLREALAAHVLARRGDAFAFRHALMAEATTADLLDGERRALHRQCADALDVPVADGADTAAARAQRTARIVFHRLRGDDSGGRAAIMACLDAAAAAEAVSAYPDAVRHYRVAIDALSRDEGRALDIDLVEVAQRAGIAASRGGQAAEAVRLTKLALGRLPADADGAQRGRLLIGLTEYLWAAGDPGYIDAQAAPASVIPSDPPSVDRAAALVPLIAWHRLTGDPVGAQRVAAEAIEVARAVGAHRELALAATFGALGFVESGQTREAREAMTTALGAVRRIEVPAHRPGVYLNLSALALLAGDEVGAIEIAAEGLRDARESGHDIVYNSGIATNAADAYLRLGDAPAAAAILDAEPPHDRDGVEGLIWAATRAQVAVELDDLDGAQRWLDIAVEAGGAQTPDTNVVRSLAIAQASLALAEHRPAGVSAIVDHALAAAPAFAAGEEEDARLLWLRARALADQAQVARARGEGSLIRVLTLEIEATLSRLDLGLARATDEMAAPRRRARRYQSLAAQERARLAGMDDGSSWATIASSQSGLRDAPIASYANLRAAACYLSSGQSGREDGRAILVATHRQAASAGLALIARECADVARRARIHLDAEGDRDSTTASTAGDAARKERASSHDLTPREVEILRLVARGLTNREIGETLFISPKTAGAHVGNILGKLGVAGRVQAATLALHEGLVEK